MNIKISALKSDAKKEIKAKVDNKIPVTSTETAWALTPDKVPTPSSKQKYPYMAKNCKIDHTVHPFYQGI